MLGTTHSTTQQQYNSRPNHQVGTVFWHFGIIAGFQTFKHKLDLTNYLCLWVSAHALSLHALKPCISIPWCFSVFAHFFTFWQHIWLKWLLCWRLKCVKGCIRGSPNISSCNTKTKRKRKAVVTRVPNAAVSVLTRVPRFQLQSGAEKAENIYIHKIFAHL